MEGKRNVVWRGTRPLIGTMVGVGIFALPFAFNEAGFGIGLAELVIVAGLNLVVLLLYADLVLAKDGHERFIGVIGKYLGSLGKSLGTLAYLAMQFGTMIAYVIAGGTFAFAVFSPVIGGSVIAYHIVFWAISSLILFGGASFVSKVQGYVIPAFFLLVAVLAIIAAPFAHLSNALSIHVDHMFLPFGVVLFAFGGLSAIPEMRDIVGKEKKKLVISIVLGTLFVSLLYAAFAFIIVSVTGDTTTLQAIDGLSKVVGPTIGVIGSLIGLSAVFSAYITVGVALVDTFVFDYRVRSIAAWGLTAIIPFGCFLFGARNFIGVIGFTGGVLSSVLGMLLIFAYERARDSHDLPKRALVFPQLLVGLAFMMYVVMFVLTLYQSLAPALLSL